MVSRNGSSGGDAHGDTERLVIGDLLFKFRGYERGPERAGSDLLVVHSTIEGGGRRLGEAGRAPAVELWDDQGNIFEPDNLDEAWYTPHEPGAVTESALKFRVPETSTGLELVLAPGDTEEIHVLLEPEDY